MSNPGYDLLGKRFGHLDVVKRLGSKKKAIYWLCQCKCGKTVERSSSIIIRRSKSPKSCGCTYKKAGSNNGSWRGYKNIPASLYTSIKHNAKTRKIKVDVTIKEIYDLFIAQDRKCALSGIKLKILESARDRTKTTASLDRIDSDKPYVKGNIQWVHKDINKMKNTLKEKRFFELCKRIVNNRRSA